MGVYIVNYPYFNCKLQPRLTITTVIYNPDCKDCKLQPRIRKLSWQDESC